MTGANGTGFDVAVIGAGPVESVAALTHARRGAKVVLLEANPRGAQRLAGEWLHPLGVEALRTLDIDLAELGPGHAPGNGFVLYPDDGSEAVVLPYAEGSFGASCPHSDLVKLLRQRAAGHADIDYWEHARVTAIDNTQLTVKFTGGTIERTIRADRIVGADGRNSIVRSALRLPAPFRPNSRMVGVKLLNVELPFENFGHVFLGGPGPVLIYRIADNAVRLIADIPFRDGGANERAANLRDAIGPLLPHSLRAAFESALASGSIEMAVNAISPRIDYGEGHYALVGDATGHYHPLTALGMTPGFDDAVQLADTSSVAAYRRHRLRHCRVPEMVAVGIYDAFSERGSDAVAVRRSIVDLWRKSPAERRRTMRYLACEDRRLPPFFISFVRVLLGAFRSVIGPAVREPHWRNGFKDYGSIIGRSWHWLTMAIFHRRIAYSPHRRDDDPIQFDDTKTMDTAAALDTSVQALLAQQQAGGGWEGEVVWCPMLAAQFVLMCHITGTEISELRRQRLLRHFEETRFDSGLWGLHAHSEPYLFVTTLVYVAARLLGVAADDPLVAPARAFITAEDGVVAIPSWGKFWLAMLGLYEWRGVNPILPEAWALPRWLPPHPGNFYCHTRLIYMAMAVIFGRKFQAPLPPVLGAVRTELYPQGYDDVKFAEARKQLRSGDLYNPPSSTLKLLYAVSRLTDRFHLKTFRDRQIAASLDRIRWELRSSDHTSISPVSGLLNIVALWLHDPDDADCRRAMERMEGWFWEDDSRGLRVTGARSASWDTAFALQAMAAAAAHTDIDGPARRVRTPEQ